MYIKYNTCILHRLAYYLAYLYKTICVTEAFSANYMYVGIYALYAISLFEILAAQLLTAVIDSLQWS